jgi:hypothetical protein
MAVKGFKEARSKVISTLQSGLIAHEARAAEKNYLADGRVLMADVIYLLKICTGAQYKADPHHALSCDVHIFRPTRDTVRWYIKVYFLSDLEPLAEGETDTMFISVHPSD